MWSSMIKSTSVAENFTINEWYFKVKMKGTSPFRPRSLIKDVTSNTGEFCQYVQWKRPNWNSAVGTTPVFPRSVEKPASHLPGEARPFAKRTRPGFPPRHDGATIKRQKVLRRSFRPPPLSSTLLQRQRAFHWVAEKVRRARQLRRFCAARTIANAAQLRPDVLTVFPNTLLRFYAREGRREEPRLVSISLSRIRLTCGICSAQTSRRERLATALFCCWLSPNRRHWPVFSRYT